MYDIGVEPPMRYYGDQIHVIGEILLSRYDQFVSKGIRTIATINLTVDKKEDRYGSKVRYRLREIFNLIAF